VGIDKTDDFALIAIGKKSLQNRLHNYLAPHLQEPDYAKNSKHLQKLFKISKTHVAAANSKTPLEDILVEKAAILVK
jgi:hypothetical protein